MRCALEGVSLTYAGHSRPAVNEITLALESGERLALMGASGSGKSTLLRLLAGLEFPTAGRVVIDGADATHASPPERGVGMVLQDAPLYEHLSVLDNVAHPLRARGASRETARLRAREMLDRMRIGVLASARSSEISGGERRRVALARAVITQPTLLLLDEPFASLDPALRMELRDEVRRLTVEIGCACVHATHDGLEALALGTRVVVLDAGRVVDDGTPDELWRRPRSPRSAVLLGALPMNVLHNGVGIRPENIRVTLATEMAPNTADSSNRSDGTNPSHGSTRSAWRVFGVVEATDSLGERELAAIRLERGDLVRAIIERHHGHASTISIGARVQLDAPADAVHRFEPRAP